MQADRMMKVMRGGPHQASARTVGPTRSGLRGTSSSGMRVNLPDWRRRGDDQQHGARGGADAVRDARRAEHRLVGAELALLAAERDGRAPLDDQVDLVA